MYTPSMMSVTVLPADIMHSSGVVLCTPSIGHARSKIHNLYSAYKKAKMIERIESKRMSTMSIPTKLPELTTLALAVP